MNGIVIAATSSSRFRLWSYILPMLLSTLRNGLNEKNIPRESNADIHWRASDVILHNICSNICVTPWRLVNDWNRKWVKIASFQRKDRFLVAIGSSSLSPTEISSFDFLVFFPFFFFYHELFFSSEVTRQNKSMISNSDCAREIRMYSAVWYYGLSLNQDLPPVWSKLTLSRRF